MARSAARSRILLLLALLGTLAACLVAAPGAVAQKRACKHADAQAGQATQRQLSRATVCLLNKQRRARHMRQLRRSKRLGRAARGHSAEMAQSKYFSHNSRSGASFLDRIRRAGYLRRARRWSVGENIAWGTGALSTPRAIVRAWMNSPGHRANILQRNFRHIGIGISFGTPVRIAGRPGATYTTDFGTRR
jgi:uncharacterized protein YkwD